MFLDWNHVSDSVDAKEFLQDRSPTFRAQELAILWYSIKLWGSLYHCNPIHSK